MLCAGVSFLSLGAGGTIEERKTMRRLCQDFGGRAEMRADTHHGLSFRVDPEFETTS